MLRVQNHCYLFGIFPPHGMTWKYLYPRHITAARTILLFSIHAMTQSANKYYD